MTLTLQLLPPWFTHTMAIAFGLVVGSFINVVVARLPHGQSIVTPRSRCPKCEKSIAWYDNIPVLSYLVLRGRCRGCKTSISVRYPAIELLVALLFLATEIKFGVGGLLLIRDWPFVASLVAITFIDLEHRIIPDELSLGGLVLGLLTAWFVPGLGLVMALVGAALGFGFFYGLSWTYYRLKGKVGLGGGDIKLLAMFGAFLGPAGVFSTVLISSVMGSVIGITYALATRKTAASESGSDEAPSGGLMNVAIPYGPFLVLGALYYYFLGDLEWLPFMKLM